MNLEDVVWREEGLVGLLKMRSRRLSLPGKEREERYASLLWQHCRSKGYVKRKA